MIKELVENGTDETKRQLIESYVNLSLLFSLQF